MKKKFLSIYMLLLISLLSCNTSDPNELTRKKMQDKKEKVLGFLEKIQTDDREIVEKHLEGIEKQKELVQTFYVEPVNVQRNSPYYFQEEGIEIKEEKLVPNTDEEKKAEKAISDGRLEFSKLVDDENKLKNESIQLESSFNNIYKEVSELVDSIQVEGYVVGRINHIIKTKLPRAKKYQKQEIQNKLEKQDLINLFNELLEKRGDIEELHAQLNSGLSERASAKHFFEKSQKTLKEAITERLKNERKNWPKLRRTSYSNLAIQAKNEIEDALNQLSISSSKIIKAIKIKEDVEQILQKAKSFLDSSKSNICSSDKFVIFTR
ncbi:P12 family lipoprotein (plasmid) [Borrelia sp. CA_690]|uniref:P12 family lipoprotein n=1 Tax=Borrelia maritima TaxID=2761123 RepID=A0A5J6WFV6_9SPIR|nr:P12 family lipoprotein [Borrelia maritima]QFI15029.1 P12 family lipoprotein [Borrelia maritima]